MHDFDWQASEHTFSNAYWLARASNWAYGDAQRNNRFPLASDGQDAMRLAGLDEAEFWWLDRDETQVMVCGHRLGLVVAFRGSEHWITDSQDWRDDFAAAPRPDIFPDGTPFAVHRGFHRALERVRADLGEHLRRSVARLDRPAWITGHSLGAALATLFAGYCLAHHGVEPRGVYTYAGPRVGNQAWANWYEPRLGSRTFRYGNSGDIALDMPPPPLYVHVGRLRFIDRSGVCVTDPAELARLEALSRGLPESLSILSMNEQSPHHLWNYLPAIEAARREGRAGVRIEGVVPARAGGSPVDEWVELVSAASEDVPMAGWVLRDRASHAYTFGNLVATPGQRLRLHTGHGQDGPTDLYWNRGQAVWNNRNGDTASLFDSRGVVRSRFTYTVP